MLETLSKDDRLLLLKFVCAFAWADLQVQKQERQFVHRLVKQLKLEKDEAKLVDGWLANPPTPEEVDPATVPRKHRKLFLDTAKKLIESDGNIDPNEAEIFELLEQLLV
ncbi:MAG: TerB family tellurite resistance protein [Polyangiaceae bacterium]